MLFSHNLLKAGTGSQRRARLMLLGAFLGVFLAVPCSTKGQSAAPTGMEQPLKLLISIDSELVTEPNALRITLHFHNAASEPLWLYQHVQNAVALNLYAPFHDSSKLMIHLQPVPSTVPSGAAAGALPPAGKGFVYESASLPHPKLVQIEAGGDAEEKAVVRLSPAMAGAQPVWGNYRLWVEYSQHFRNADALNRDLNTLIWQGNITSNTVSIQLQPAPASARGSVSGIVVDAQSRPSEGILVSLTDHEGRMMGQSLTAADGRFEFSHLPEGEYWVTVRDEQADVETGLVKRAMVQADSLSPSLRLILFNIEIDQARQMLHKPVLIRVIDRTGPPLEGVNLDVTWSSGAVLDDIRAKTDANGIASLELIPGSNYVSLKHKGCPEQDERADVAEGDGIDGFIFTSRCEKK